MLIVGGAMGLTLLEHKIVIEPIKLQYIDSYLAQFSVLIQRTLLVGAIESERSYITDRCLLAQFFFVIKEQMSDNIIGAIEIRDAGHVSQLYCWINEQYWGRGYFYQALRQAARIYYDATQKETISACVYEHNTQSLRALLKNGFKKKGSRLGPQGKQIILQLHINDIL